MTHGRAHSLVLPGRERSRSAKIRSRMCTVEDVASDTGILYLALLAAGAYTMLTARAPARATFALLLRLFHVPLQDSLLIIL